MCSVMSHVDHNKTAMIYIGNVFANLGITVEARMKITQKANQGAIYAKKRASTSTNSASEPVQIDSEDIIENFPQGQRLVPITSFETYAKALQSVSAIKHGDENFFAA